MLDSLFPDREDSRRFVVYSANDDREPAALLATRNLELEHRRLPPDAPEPFLVIETEGEFVGAIPLDAVERLFEPPVIDPDERTGVSEGYQVLFDALDETLYSAMNRRQLLAVSREIEDRAYRLGTGTLRVSFQQLSTFESQVDVYRHLATDTALDIHVYGAADWDPPAIDGVTYHATDTLQQYWALAFVGAETSALVARETADGYDGFWTDDPERTREVAAALKTA